MYETYQGQLIDQAALMLTLSGRVSQTQQVLATQFSFRLKTPDLLIKVTTHSNKSIKMGKRIDSTQTCMHQQMYACTHTHTRTHPHTHICKPICTHIHTHTHTHTCQEEEEFDRDLIFT